MSVITSDQSRTEEVGEYYFPSSFSLPLLPSILSPFPYPPLPLEVGPLNMAWNMGRVVRSPSGVWGRAPEEIKFGAFSYLVAPIFTNLDESH